MTARPSTRAQRATINDMAYYLATDVIELANDTRCFQALLLRGFRAFEIYDHIDTARDLARAARTCEADLWDKLMRERT